MSIKCLQTLEFYTTCKILGTNFNVPNNHSMTFIYASLMLSNALKMTKKDRNKCEKLCVKI